jgi:arylsulfatase A-like enzyme
MSTSSSGGITRRDFVKFSAAGLALLGLPALNEPAAAAAKPKRRPNLVLIVTDEERHWSRIESLVPPERLAAFREKIPGRMRLRKSGVRFNRYYTPTAPCSPARGVLFTGHHAPDNGVVDNMDFDAQDSLNAALPTMADVLGKAGYYCAYKGKVHLARDEDLRNARDMLGRYGFHDWQGPFGLGDSEGPLSGAMRDDEVAGYARDWLRGKGRKLRRKNQPFLLAVNFINPHDVMMVDVDGREGTFQIAQGPNPTSEDYDPNASNSFPLSPIPRQGAYLYWWDPVKPANADGENGYGVASSGPRPQMLDEWASILSGGFGNITLDDNVRTPIQVYRDNADPGRGLRSIEVPLWQVYLNYYLNCIVDNDRSVSTVLDAVVANGFDRDTLVVFTADHGELALSHMGVSRYFEAARTSGYETPEEVARQAPKVMPLRQKGPFVYEENNQLPLVVARLTDQARAPVTQLLPTVDVDVPVLASSVDLLPTLLALAGKTPRWYTQKFGRTLDGLGLLDRLPGVSLHRVLGAPAKYTTAKWSDGQNGRDWVLFTCDTTASSIDADYAYLAIWGQCAGKEPDLTRRGCLRGLYDGEHKYVRFFSPEDYAVNGSAYAAGGYAELTRQGSHGQDIQLFVHGGNQGSLEIYNSAADPGAPLRTLNPLLYAAMNRELARVEVPPDTVQRMLNGEADNPCT